MQVGNPIAAPIAFHGGPTIRSALTAARDPNPLLASFPLVEPPIDWKAARTPEPKGISRAKCTVQHQRGLVGNDITVAIDTERDRLIARVTMTLDGFAIGDDWVDPPSVSYERQFLQAGDASPGLHHELIVTITDPKGEIGTTVRRWQDML